MLEVVYKLYIIFLIMVMMIRKDYFYDIKFISYLYVEKNHESKSTGEIIIYKGYYKKNNDEIYVVILNGDIKYSINTNNEIHNLMSIIKSNLFIDITNKKCLLVNNRKRVIVSGNYYSGEIKHAKKLVKCNNSLFLLK